MFPDLMSPPHLKQRGRLQMSSSCINQTIYHFTVFILIRTVLIRANAMLSKFVHISSSEVCQLLVAAGSNHEHLRKEHIQYT